MKKLVLHSDQIPGKTEVDKASLRLFNTDKPKIAYIPSKSDLERKYFNQKVEWYKQFGINNLFYFDLDQEYNPNNLDKLLSSDGILLSGGNTFYFLNSLRRRNFIPILQGFVEKGGVLIGLSAGSILMSKTIAMSQIGNDNNTVRIKDLSALGLNNFDFFPHFNPNNQELILKLKDYSLSNHSTVYACQNGDGIIVNDKDIQLIGQVTMFENGTYTLGVY